MKLILFAVALGAFTLACQRAPEMETSSEVQDRLRTEFKGSYPAKAPDATGVREYKMTAAPSTIELFQGKRLEVWAYNHQVPGPTLRVKLGETLRVLFTNNLPQPTTVHWHGVRVPNAMDGVPGVTQPAIEPGATFTYEFTPKDAGTFWFHPHVRGAEQVERGLFGVLVVEDAANLGFGRDEAWVLDDWRLGADAQIDPRFVTRHDLAHDGRWGQVVTVNASARYELVAAPGERIRLRLVNTANARIFRPTFEGLDAKVIAVDGMYVAGPVGTEPLELAPGNRVDLDITIPSDAADKTFPVIDRFTRRAYRLASIRVAGKAVPTPEVAIPRASIPAWADASSAPVHTEFTLNARRGGPHGIEWLINGKPYSSHDARPLTQDKWHKLRFKNDSSRLHPMHLHGQFFKVIARNGRAVDEPYFRDTVLLRGRETIDVGLVPLDRGDWMLHCHILEHAEAGMMTIVEVRPAD